MVFNSIDFAVFLPLAFLIYWFVIKRLNHQNIFLVLASYLFYGWWDWRFLSLIIFSSGLDFIIGKKIGAEQDARSRKRLLWLSLTVNLGFLGVFKYFDFFSSSFAEAFTYLGRSFDPFLLDIILPVGISFYTFQTLSYTIDVYRRKLEPSSEPVAFFAFVSFFPQLVAGPIERASHLLPQFYRERQFDYHKAVDGLRQMLWGLFKKVVIADNCAVMANKIFENHESQPPSFLLIGALMFTFQIYGDFSGYSDIAIGTARLFGFDLKQNFAFPYFSRDIAEFWRRWHISLSSWFKDYVYIPLGGSKGGTAMRVRNTFIIFLVSGFWHGANWTFIAWGLLNALYFLPLLLLGSNRKNTDVAASDSRLPSVREVVQIGFTFSLTVIAWIFFRSISVGDAWTYILNMFSGFASSPKQLLTTIDMLIDEPITYGIMFLIALEWWSRKDQHGLDRFLISAKRPLRWTFYLVLIFLTLYQDTKDIGFIYFQF